MVVTLIDAMMAAEIGANIIMKAVAAAKAGKVADLTKEIELLESCRLAPADDIIAEADKAMGKG